MRAQWGLGDSIFVRPFVRAATSVYSVYLETPWPELFEDLPVKFVRLERRLRTQMKNVHRQPSTRWSSPPADAQVVSAGYNGEDLRTGSIVQTLERKYRNLGVVPSSLKWDLPDTGPCPVRTSKPIALVRPCTLRREWKNAARNPRPDYINWVVENLMRTHHVVLVADVAGREEWLENGALPKNHQSFLCGQLDLRSLIALARHADVLIGGVGWIVPASVALGVKAFVILGGHGAHNHPRLITDPRMDLSRLTFATPERFCLCSNMAHNCDKTIRTLPQQWAKFKSRVLDCSTRAQIAI